MSGRRKSRFNGPAVPVPTPPLAEEVWSIDPELDIAPVPEPYTDEHGIKKNHHGYLPQHQWLTPRKYKILVRWIRNGHFLHTACARVGISRENCDKWLKLARDPDAHPIYRYFVRDVEKAEARYRDDRLQAIKGGEALDWRAAAWQLGVRFPEQYAEKVRIQVDNLVQQNVNAVLNACERVLSPEDYDKVLEELNNLRLGAAAACLPAADDRLSEV